MDDSIRDQIKKSNPLPERLLRCRTRIMDMCAQNESPIISDPTKWTDDDVFFGQTLSDAYYLTSRTTWLMKQVASFIISTKNKAIPLYTEESILRQLTELIKFSEDLVPDVEVNLRESF